MKATDLRVTNMVMFRNFIINPILFIGYDAVQLITPEGQTITATLLDINPVSLTEEWLLRCGFKKVIEHFSVEDIHYENKNCWVYLLEDCFEIEVNCSDKRFNLWRQYKKELHILQNLYKEIFQEELTIKF